MTHKCFVVFTVLTVHCLAMLPSAQADLIKRWTTTATDGFNNTQGDPATLTWGFLTEGTTITSGQGEPSSPSNLIGFLDSVIGAGGGGSNLTTRPWFAPFQTVMNRWSQVSGLSFVYEPNDDGVTLNNSPFSNGILGTRADIRIGGHSVDGQNGLNVLAYSYFPDNSDMVIDTDNSTLYGDSTNDFIGMRNVVSHELGHGLGLDHRESNNSNFLMEPITTTAFDGPQFDDIWGIQRGYGDALEKGSGNDIFQNAHDLGMITAGNQLRIGADAVDQFVAPDETDFVSIDGSSDVDFYSFSLDEAAMIDLVLEPLGPTYNKGPQNSAQSPFDASAQSDLLLELLGTDGVTSLAIANANGLGGTESLLDFSLGSGTYFARIVGSEDRTQLYQLTARISVVPEPGAWVLLSMASVLLTRHRRRQ